MKLRLTEGYRPRFDQISRIMIFIFSQDQRVKIPRNDIITALGIQNKQIENLLSIMIGFGLVYPRITTLTKFGIVISQTDPYFEKIETLWMIHYTVSSNPEWVVWHRIVNKVFPIHEKISVDFVCNNYFSDLESIFSEKTISNKLPNEVSAVFGAYTRTKLSLLNILVQDGNGKFIKSNPVEIPALAFLYCLLYYRDKFFSGSSALNVEEICIAKTALAEIFNMPEYQVRTILDNLHNNGLIRLEQMANLDQVRFPETTTQDSVLRAVYGGLDAN